MRRRTATVLLALLFVASAVPARASEPADAGPDLSDSFGSDADVQGAADPSGRFIVVLKEGADVQAKGAGHNARNGVAAERVFTAVGAYTAKLTKQQRAALAADPDVAAVVPDEIIELQAQSMPTGVARIGGRYSPAAAIDGVDHRVDADVAVVDTGIDPTHSDLNVVGGVNCSTSDRSAWRDVHGHGTHVAGTIGALDDNYGVVGVAPGVRLWAVKILDDTGSGLLSWYVCGLDWIAAQRDPTDSSRPLIEAVNMSVAKWGRDDGACGTKTSDILHAGICRLTATGVTVVAAAANDANNAALRVPAAYDEVITVSALADTDGRPGGLGGNRCLSWGTYDVDDTFADFSNWGPDVDLIAPGKCIWSTLPGERFGWSSGTSMAAPHVAGAVALLKSGRPWMTNSEVTEALQYLGNYNWATSTDPDGRPDILLDVTRIGGYGDFSLAAPGQVTVQPGQTVHIPVTVNRSTTHFERVGIDVVSGGDMSAAVAQPSLFGFEATAATVTLTIPPSHPGGSQQVVVRGVEHGRTRQATVGLIVSTDRLNRLAGSDRFSTAAAISGATFNPGVGTVYIANAFAFPDALAGAGAAGTVQGPILLAAATGSLHPATTAELSRLKPARIVVLGGPGVLAESVYQQLWTFLPTP